MEHYKKIDDNNVEVYVEKTVKDVDDVDRIILEYKESYGQKVIDEEMSLLAKELLEANDFDSVKYKDDLVAEMNTMVYKLGMALNLFERETLEDKDGNTFEVFKQEDVESNITKGKQVPDSLREYKQKVIEANKIDPVSYKQERIDEVQAKIDRLKLIQAVLDKKEKEVK